jgi:hypothetical protein
MALYDSHYNIISHEVKLSEFGKVHSLLAGDLGRNNLFYVTNRK